MSRTATDFSCSDATYDPASEESRPAPAEPIAVPHNPVVVGTPAPPADEQPDDEQQDENSS